MAFALLATTAGAVAISLVGWLGFVGKLPPNHWAGIRTPFTSRSNEAWYATHRSAGPYVILTGAPAIAAGVAFLPFAIAGQIPVGVVVIIGALQGLLIGGGAVMAWLIGTARAKASFQT
jgi:uncharacterized membrane protein